MQLNNSQHSQQTSRTASPRKEVEQILWPFPPLSPEKRTASLSGVVDMHRGDILEPLEGTHDYLLLIDRVHIGNRVCFLLFSASTDRFVVWTEGDVITTDGNVDPPQVTYNRTPYAVHQDVVDPADNTPLATTTTIDGEELPKHISRSWYPYNDPPSLLSPASPTAPDRIGISSPSQSAKNNENQNDDRTRSTDTFSVSDIRNEFIVGDALEQLQLIPDNVFTAWITSPPYPGAQRDYNCAGQIGTESPDDYLAKLLAVIDEVFRTTHPCGTGWLVIDDTITNGEYCGVPDRLVGLLREYDYKIINNGPFVKEGRGAPDPASKRFAHDHERIIGIAQQDEYHFDREAPENDSDVIEAPTHAHTNSTHKPRDGVLGDVNHDAPYSTELITPIVQAIKPDAICSDCGRPYDHVYEVTDIFDLKDNPKRDDVERHIRQSEDFTEQHAWACRTVGISDTGQAARTENGASESNKAAEELYREIENDDFDFPHSYRRQFASYAKKDKTGIEQQCDCETTEQQTPLICDPFVGIGTTPYVVSRLGADYVGIDLNEEYIEVAQRRLNEIDSSLAQFTD